MTENQIAEGTQAQRRSKRGRGRMRPGVPPLTAFVSSVMRPDVSWAREEAFSVLDRPDWLVPWLFEQTPASSDAADDSYLDAVRRADIVIWLVAKETTEPVRKEIREALAS